MCYTFVHWFSWTLYVCAFVEHLCCLAFQLLCTSTLRSLVSWVSIVAGLAIIEEARITWTSLDTYIVVPSAFAVCTDRASYFQTCFIYTPVDYWLLRVLRMFRTIVEIKVSTILWKHLIYVSNSMPTWKNLAVLPIHFYLFKGLTVIN